MDKLEPSHGAYTLYITLLSRFSRYVISIISVCSFQSVVIKEDDINRYKFIYIKVTVLSVVRNVVTTLSASNLSKAKIECKHSLSSIIIIIDDYNIMDG